VVTFVYVPHVSVTVLYSGWFQSVFLLITDVPSAVGQFIFVSMIMFHLSFSATAVKSPFTPVLCHPVSVLTFLPKCLGITSQLL
jgi:hypothetical protein